MIPKIADRHLSRHACIYIRQSTLAQVRFNQESTDRQYNLMNKARLLGWNQEQIRVLDRDLGKSGAAANTRTDFKTLVGDVAMGQVTHLLLVRTQPAARQGFRPPSPIPSSPSSPSQVSNSPSGTSQGCRLLSQMW
jgi:hypothetical protein